MNPIEKNFKGKRIHILGVAGTLMGSFAAYLKKQGVDVTGSDQNIYPPMSDVLKNAGVEIFSGYAPENIAKARPDLVIVGNVIRRTNAEMEEIARKNIKYLSLPSALEEMVLPSKHPLVIAGTHGKTTTTTIMAFLLESLGLNPSFFIGGVPQNFSESFRITDSKFMALEGDEYDTAFFDKVPKFVHYRPQDVILTSIEFDHADIYKNLDEVVRAFDTLVQLVPASGHLIVSADSPTVLTAAKKCRGKVVSYGFESKADSCGSNLKLSSNGIYFEWKGFNVTFPMSGKHNALNLLSCLTLLDLLKLDVGKAIQALPRFQGVKRRQETYGEAKGITLIDDFAHHPTAVRETLQAIRSRYPKNRVIACFEPRSATSRRKVFQEDYAKSFDSADLVFIAKPYDQSNIDDKELFSTEELIKDIGKKACLLSTSETGLQDFSKNLKEGDIVLTMSNGGFDGFLPKLMGLLKK